VITAAVGTLFGSADPFSISLWARPEDLPPDNRFPQIARIKNGPGCGTFGGALILDGPASGHAAAELSEGCSGSNRTSSAIPAGEWRHLAVAYDGSIAKFFISGVEVSQVEYLQTAVEPAASLVIVGGGVSGLSADDDNSIFQFFGSIDDVSFYSRAIDASEVLRLSEE
jgi:hypothetical protein